MNDALSRKRVMYTKSTCTKGQQKNQEKKKQRLKTVKEKNDNQDQAEYDKERKDYSSYMVLAIHDDVKQKSND